LGTLEDFEPEFYEQMRESWKGINIPPNKEGEMEVDRLLKGVGATKSTRKTSITKGIRKGSRKLKLKRMRQKFKFHPQLIKTFC